MNNGRILIVEDELLFAVDLANNLESIGYEIVEKVTNGKEALEKAQILKPDLIMMDIKLDGDLSGIDTSQLIKDTLDIPVIFLTAHSDVQTIEEAKLTEPYGFLLKPLRLDEVNSMIKTALHKHQIENKLKESEKRFRDMTDLLPQPVFEVDLDGIVSFANRSFLEYFSLDSVDVKKGINFYSLFPSEMEPQVRANFEKILQGIACVNCEIKVLDKKGNSKFTLFYANRIIHKDAVTGIRGTITDISERIEAERDIRTQKHFFETIFDNSPEAIASTDKNGNIIRVNAKFESLFGFNKDEVLGKNIDELLSPGPLQDEAVRFTQSVVNERMRKSLETKRRHKDGRLIDTIVVGNPVISGNKQVDFTIAIYIDITSRKKTERELKQIHELYQKTIQNANGVPYRLNLESKEYEFVGSGLEEILGLPQKDFNYEYFKNMKQEVIVHDKCDYSTYKEKFRNGELDRYQVDFKFVDHKGRERWISDCSLPVFSYDEREVVESIGVLQDITQRKLIEKQLRLEKNKLQNYLDVAGVIFLSLDVNMNVNLINRKGCKILGLEPHEILGKNWIENFLPPNIRDKIWEFFDHFMNQQIDMFSNDYKRSAQFESKLISKDNVTRNILWNNILLRDENKVITGVLCSGTDITDKVVAEQGVKKLNQILNQKNHDLERIIYVTSHDLRSPLVNIEGFSEELNNDVNLILTEIEQAGSLDELKIRIEKIVKQDIPESIGFIKNSVLKIESLLSALLQLSRLGRQQLDLKVLNMNDLIDSILSTFEYRIKREKIDVRVSNLPECIADAKQINQLFSNLIGNAMKFFHPDRPGEIEIRGRKMEKFSYYYVWDNGIGIKREDQDKIFEIFKRVHNNVNIEGDGLGLSIVRRILEKNHGEIRVESEYEKWTKFTVVLPNIRFEDE
ncbi:MAG: PAS domain S-box protein [Candidatus Marinimicrobia bacterium]|nr:PAS domain S-box protein [Candidatus Neomarinimicrobiota bacterium]